MYGIIAQSSLGSNLYKINLETGAMTEVGMLGGKLSGMLACSPQGNLYIIDSKCDLYSVNKNTAAVTLVGSTVEEMYWYKQSFAFDKTSGRLFWVTSNYEAECKLLEVDPTTGIVFDRGNIGNNSGITGLFILPDEAPQQFTVTVSANPANAGTVTGGGTFYQGESVTVTASANTGFKFVNWTENGSEVSTDNNYSFNIVSNRTLTANFEDSLGISNELPSGLNIYPNPVSNKLKIVRSANDNAQIEIYNTTGIKIETLEMKGKEIEINFADKQSGIYFLRLIEDKNVSTIRLIKQ